FGVEDQVAIIDPATLVINDVAEGAGQLTLVSVQNAQSGTVSITPDGKISFRGVQDFNGDAAFDYTVRDQFGRESTATVEIDLAAVNDAPVARDDDPFAGFEDQILFIPLSRLLANDTDVDGSATEEGLHITSISPLLGLDGNPIDPYFDLAYQGEGTNVAGRFNGEFLELK